MADVQSTITINAETQSARSNIGRLDQAFREFLKQAGASDEEIKVFLKVAKDANASAETIAQLSDKTRGFFKEYRLGNELARAKDIIGLVPHARIRDEIARVTAAFETLKRSGTLSQAELAQAAEKTKLRIQELNAAMSEGTAEAERKTLGFAAALKTLAAAAAVREFIQTNSNLEVLQKTLEVVTGSSEGAAQELEFVRSKAAELGLESISTSRSFVQLAAAAKGTALEGQATRDIWTAVAGAMAKLGKTGADTEGALIAISQIMSKGTVSAEELRGQLGERLPGAFQAAARAVGVTTEELGSLLQRGELVAEDFLPKLAAELNKTFGGGGEVNTFTANWNRFKNSITETLAAIGNTGLFSALSSGLSLLASAINAVTVGFISLQKYLAATGVSISHFITAVKTLDFSHFREEVKRAFAEAQIEIANASDRLFGTDANLKAVAASGTKAGAAVAAGAAKGSEGVVKLSKDVRELLDELNRSGGGAEDFQKTFTEFFNKSGALQKGEEGMRQFAAFLDKIKESAPAAGEAITKGLGDALEKRTPKQLSDLSFYAEATFAGMKGGVEKIALVNEAVLGASVRKLGLDYDTLAGKVSAVSREGIEGFKNIAETAGATSRTITASFNAALGKVKETAGLKELDVLLRNAFNAKQIGLPEFQESLDRLKLRQRELAEATNDSARLYQELGIKSQEALEIAAEKARRNYEALVALDKPLADQRAGFLAYAKTAIEAAKASGKSVDGLLRTQAAALGLTADLGKLTEENKKLSASIETVARAQDEAIKQSEAHTRAVEAEGRATIETIKAAIEQAKARGNVAEATRLTIALAEAESAVAAKVAEAKRAEAQASAEKVAALEREVAADNELTEAERELLAVAKEAAAAKAAEADSATIAASAKAASAKASGKQAEAEQGVVVLLDKAVELQQERIGLVARYGETAAEAYNKIAQAIEDALRTEGGFLVNSGNLLERVRREASAATDEILGLIARLAAAEEPAQGLIEKGTQALRTYAALGEENLEPLRKALADAQKRTEDLRAAARDTLQNLQDELDRLRGNEAEIERRNAEARRRELEAQLAEARKEGDQARIRDLTASLKILEEIGREQRRQRDEEKRAAAERRREESRKPASAKDDTAPPAKTPSPPARERVERVIERTGDQLNITVQVDPSKLTSEDWFRRSILPHWQRWIRLTS